MPTYRPSFVTETYNFAANPPNLDKVVFTIDHIHPGAAGVYSTVDIVQYLVSKRIPVTLFIECTDPFSACAKDENNAQELVNIDPNLVSLGFHTLVKGKSSAKQIENFNRLQRIIKNIIQTDSIIGSYHGGGAGPEPGINYPGIKFMRGIKSDWSTTQVDNPLNTPVMGLGSENTAFNFIKNRNLANLSATLFVHTNELISGSKQKLVFDTIIKAVEDRKLQALPYEQAMQSDYGSTITPPVDSIDCALKHFTNNSIEQFLRINSRDGVNGNFQVSELQNFLNEIGLNAGLADGIFGPNTKLAVIAYQITEGLVPDGIVGRNTRASINSYCD